MAIDAFAWKIQASGQPAVTVKDNIRKVQFGDGYTQVSGNGLNSETLNYAFSYTGKNTALEIYAFLRSHKTKSFSFQPPYGELALWRVQADSLQLIVKSKKLITITATFEQAFAP
jgi:phage-related protein